MSTFDAFVVLVEENPPGAVAVLKAIVDPLVDHPELLTDGVAAIQGGEAALFGFAAKHPLYSATVMKAALDLFRNDPSRLSALVRALSSH